MDISIIIVNWNVCDILHNCLQSIYNQTSGIHFEVIVIDNASSDSSVVMIKSKFPKVILIENSKNKGFAAANNQGIKIAHGCYVLCLNPDTIILNGAIQKSVQYADLHQEAAVIGCQVWLNSDEIQKTCFSYPSLRNMIIRLTRLNRIFPQSIIFGKEAYSWWDRRTPMEVDVVSGMFMLVRKTAIEQVGIMDESYFVYAEETDWCYRFNKAGWKCLFTPSASIIHLDGGDKSTSQASVKMFVQMQKSTLIFMRKHYGRISWLLAKFLYIITMFFLTSIGSVNLIISHNEKTKQNVSQLIAAMRYHITGAQPK